MDLQKKLHTIITDIFRGIPIILTDNDDREAEGDLMIAAEFATPETLAFIAREARGIMCIPTAGHILDKLEIPMSPSNNFDKFSTPFTVSVDARHGITTGVSVHDRMKTIDLFLNWENTNPEELAYPGHMFPLRPRPGLLTDRQGHTEASVQLCLLAKLKPIAIISEIMNSNGSMARTKDLEEYANTHELKMISIDEIMDYMYGEDHG